MQWWFDNPVVRPREYSDGWLLDCAQRALAATGPSRWTLAEAAGLAGVSAATYVHRFGSKHEVVVALSHRWISSITPGIGAVTTNARPGREQVLAAALWGFAELDDADRAGANLVILAGDLVDPDLRVLLAQGWRLVQQELQTLIRAAHRAEALLMSPPSAQAASMIGALAIGASLDWSVRPHGHLLDRLRRDLDALFDRWDNNQEGQRNEYGS